MLYDTLGNWALWSSHTFLGPSSERKWDNGNKVLPSKEEADWRTHYALSVDTNPILHWLGTKEDRYLPKLCQYMLVGMWQLKLVREHLGIHIMK